MGRPTTRLHLPWVEAQGRLICGTASRWSDHRHRHNKKREDKEIATHSELASQEGRRPPSCRNMRLPGLHATRQA